MTIICTFSPCLTLPIIPLRSMNICNACLRFLLDEKEKSNHCAADETSFTCSICFGILTIDDGGDQNGFRQHLLDALHKAMDAYGGGENRISFQSVPPVIVPSADILYRYSLAAKERGKNAKHEALMTFGNSVKQTARAALKSCLQEIEQQCSEKPSYPPYVIDEEQGFLCVFVILTPSKDVIRPTDLLKKKPSERRKKRRKLDDKTQGGDPRLNLERRLEQQGVVLWPINQYLNEGFSDFEKFQSTYQREILSQDFVHLDPLDFHVAIWRRPFYLRGEYTKFRRDISQSPFFVTENGVRVKLGVSSVEEQILPSITRFCGEISTTNNNPTDDQIVFGMAKFHASGREDMDVRMLLPDSSIHKDIITCSGNVTNEMKSSITARPFVCEITDAFKMPREEKLIDIVREINHTSGAEKSDAAPINDNPRFYGCNPMGVGISSNFRFAHSSSFGELQAETEGKVKYYGCLCWSKDSFSSLQALQERLHGSNRFPLEISQRTPIRVLHRRSNAIRVRHVLSCLAIRIDDHYFRLHLSTDAGTYVKEFVHGDLGRTVPSVASILGCKTDILELDCEGIQATTRFATN